jgi:hypothetical protein
LDHHFVPQFYLKQWADPNGRIPNYRWIRDRAVFGHVPSTQGTGFERDLYAQEHVSVEDRHKVETHFFKLLDTKAAIIHARFIELERFTLTPEERTDWAIFLAAATARTPEKIAHFKRTLAEAVRANLRDTDPAEIEKALGYKPPFTLLEWTEKHFPGQIANFHLRMLIKHMTREELVQLYMDMDWTVHRVRSRHKELLTCDRPLWYLHNPNHPNFTMMMTLSPRVVFIAAKSQQLADSMAATPTMRLARLINQSVFNAAQERVYGRTTLEYAQRAFSLTRRNRRHRAKVWA